MRINKQELISRVAAASSSPSKNVEVVVSAMISEITRALKEGDSVLLIDLGLFKVSPRQARKGRNPSTGEIIEIPARKAVSFKAGSKLSKVVNDESK
jgi:DNA-binding protein HU-beta